MWLTRRVKQSIVALTAILSVGGFAGGSILADQRGNVTAIAVQSTPTPSKTRAKRSPAKVSPKPTITITKYVPARAEQSPEPQVTKERPMPTPRKRVTQEAPRPSHKVGVTPTLEETPTMEATPVPRTPNPDFVGRPPNQYPPSEDQ